MNAITILKEDHQKFLKLFDKIEQNTEQNKRDIFFQQLQLTITTHMLSEERVFYPAVKRYSEIADVIDKSFQSHHFVNVGLKELHTTPFDSETWLPKFQAIRDSIITHMCDEENCLFPKVMELMDLPQLESLGNDILKLRSSNHTNEHGPMVDPSTQITS